jgi:DNA-binding response OmpR family regulator
MANRALVADDSARLRLLLSRIVQLGGHAVLTAEDGDVTLAIALAEACDVAILDVQLPGQDGLAICRVIRSDLEARATRIIISGDPQAAAAQEAGADVFLQKPFSPRVLLATIDELISE